MVYIGELFHHNLGSFRNQGVSSSCPEIIRKSSMVLLKARSIPFVKRVPLIVSQHEKAEMEVSSWRPSEFAKCSEAEN